MRREHTVEAATSHTVDREHVERAGDKRIPRHHRLDIHADKQLSDRYSHEQVQVVRPFQCTSMIFATRPG